MMTHVSPSSCLLGVTLLSLLLSARSDEGRWALKPAEVTRGLQLSYQVSGEAGMSVNAVIPRIGDPFIHFELGGAHSASFTVLRHPQPVIFDLGSSFMLENVPGTFEGVDGTRSIRFFNNSLNGGFEVLGDFKVNYTQLYSGIENNPFFYSGDYLLLDSITGKGAGLIAFPNSLPPTPEPSSGVLLVLGLVGWVIGWKTMGISRAQR